MKITTIIRFMVFVFFLSIVSPLMAKYLEFNNFSFWMPDDYTFYEIQSGQAIGFQNKYNSMRIIIAKSMHHLLFIEAEIARHKNFFGIGTWSEPKSSIINAFRIYTSIAILKRPEGIVGGTILIFDPLDDPSHTKPVITFVIATAGTERDMKDISQIIQSVKLISK